MPVPAPNRSFVQPTVAGSAQVPGRRDLRVRRPHDVIGKRRPRAVERGVALQRGAVDAFQPRACVDEQPAAHVESRFAECGAHAAAHRNRRRVVVADDVGVVVALVLELASDRQAERSARIDVELIARDPPARLVRRRAVGARVAAREVDAADVDAVIRGCAGCRQHRRRAELDVAVVAARHGIEARVEAERVRSVGARVAGVVGGAAQGESRGEARPARPAHRARAVRPFVVVVGDPLSERRHDPRVAVRRHPIDRRAETPRAGAAGDRAGRVPRAVPPAVGRGIDAERSAGARQHVDHRANRADRRRARFRARARPRCGRRPPSTGAPRRNRRRTGSGGMPSTSTSV